MIKVLNQYLPRRWAVLLLGESLLILLALAVATALEAGSWRIQAAPSGLVLKALLITLVCQLCLHYSDLYTPNTRTTGAEVLARLLQALGIASLVLALVYWMLPSTRLSTGLVAGSVLAMVLILLGWRRAMDWAVSWAQQAYPAGERLLLLGTGARAVALAHELQLRPQLSLELVGALNDGAAPADGAPLPVLGTMESVAEAIAAHHPHRIVIAMQERRGTLPIPALLAARAAGVRVEEASTLMEQITGRVALDSLRPSWLIFSDGFHKSAWLRACQRGSSIAVSLLGLVLASPIMLLVAIAVRLESPGPIIFRQQRVGLDGECFDVLKFRSMRVDAERESGPVWAQERDPRVTRVGRVLRTLRLDELPQLVNVLQGNMNIVGPRPERPGFVDQFRQSIPFYDMRHTVRPGVTGWAQVSRDYGASLDDAREKLEFDLFYIKNMSVWLDLFILFQTTKIVFLGRGAR